MMEKKKMIIAIVIGVSCLFWIIAAILFVCAKGVDRRISESKKDCVEKTTATVVDMEEVYKRNVDTYNYTWYPAYEFYVNGERVVQKSVIGTGKNSVQKRLPIRKHNGCWDFCTGKDYVPTDGWTVFSHQFSSIAGLNVPATISANAAITRSVNSQQKSRKIFRPNLPMYFSITIPMDFP